MTLECNSSLVIVCSDMEDDNRLFQSENHLLFACLESCTSHTTIDGAVSAADDMEDLAPDKRYMLSTADENNGVL